MTDTSPAAMTPKETYRQLCRQEKSIPVFSRDWWLDAVCGEGLWDVLLVYGKQGRVEAAMPVYMPRKGYVVMPPYTQTMGPWMAAASPDAKYAGLLGKRQAALGELASRLGNLHLFRQNFSWTVTDWLPFYWQGFRQTTRYTYLLGGLHDSSLLWENMGSNIRRNIVKAEKKYKISVRSNVPADEFVRIQRLTFQRQRLAVPKGENVLRRLIEVSRRRNQGDIWGGYDEDGRLHAAVFIVWQESSAYYLAGGGDPGLRHSGAHSLVMWKAIREVAAFTDNLDFEGSMIPGVERFFREFGARQTPYFAVSKGRLNLWKRLLIRLGKARRQPLPPPGEAV